MWLTQDAIYFFTDMLHFGNTDFDGRTPQTFKNFVCIHAHTYATTHTNNLIILIQLCFQQSHIYAAHLWPQQFQISITTLCAHTVNKKKKTQRKKRRRTEYFDLLEVTIRGVRLE